MVVVCCISIILFNVAPFQATYRYSIIKFVKSLPYHRDRAGCGSPPTAVRNNFDSMKQNPIINSIVCNHYVKDRAADFRAQLKDRTAKLRTFFEG
jgi:hypothetical protein